MTNKPCENHTMLLTQVKCGVRIMLKAEDNRGIRERDDEGMAGEKYRYHKNAERFTLFRDAVDMQIQVNRDAEKRILESALLMKKLSNV